MAGEVTFLSPDNINQTPVSAANPLPVTAGAGGTIPVQPPYSRVALLTTTVTLTSTGYTAGQAIGPALQVSAGGSVGAQIATVRVRSIKVAFTTASSTALGAIIGLTFSAAPTTTLANGSVPTWNGADAAKFQVSTTLISAGAATSTGAFYDSDGANTGFIPLGRTMTTDASGNINLALIAQAAITYTTPTTATVTVEIEY